MASSAQATPSARTIAEGKPMAAETIAGIGGLVFLSTIILQNIISVATMPANDASAAQILQFANDSAWVVELFAVTFVFGFGGLFLFAAGVAGYAEETSRAGRLWGRLGRSSVGVIAAFFGTVTVLEITLVAARVMLADNESLAVLLWTLRNAFFTINLLAIGGALLGLSRAASIGGLIPRKLGMVTIVGALLLAAASGPAVTEVHGSPLLAVGLVGFFCWMIFIAVASARLLRVGTAKNAANVS